MALAMAWRGVLSMLRVAGTGAPPEPAKCIVRIP
jgi:hypothetical protein